MNITLLILLLVVGIVILTSMLCTVKQNTVKVIPNVLWRLRKMKKKVILGILTMSLLVGTTGCGAKKVDSSSNTPSNQSSTTNATTESKSNHDSNPLSEKNLLAMAEDNENSCLYIEINGEICITGYDTKGKEIAIIPSKIKGKDVTQIKGAFKYNNTVKAVVIPAQVAIIGEESFTASSKLEIVVFKGNKVIEIGTNAFMAASNLTKIKLPDSIQEIGTNAFAGCSNLSVINFPLNLKKIGNGAFNSTKLETVVLPNGLETIDKFAFSYCDNLKSCTIPSSIISIGENCFGKSDKSTSGLTIITPKGSYAETYAKGLNIKVENK